MLSSLQNVQATDFLKAPNLGVTVMPVNPTLTDIYLQAASGLHTGNLVKALDLR